MGHRIWFLKSLSFWRSYLYSLNVIWKGKNDFIYLFALDNLDIQLNWLRISIECNFDGVYVWDDIGYQTWCKRKQPHLCFWHPWLYSIEECKLTSLWSVLPVIVAELTLSFEALLSENLTLKPMVGSLDDLDWLRWVRNCRVTVINSQGCYILN